MTHDSKARTAKNAFYDMEGPANEAMRLSTALSMAIEGIGKLDVSDEDEIGALRNLAFEVRINTAKVRALWYESYELDRGAVVPMKAAS